MAIQEKPSDRLVMLLAAVCAIVTFAFFIYDRANLETEEFGRISMENGHAIGFSKGENSLPQNPKDDLNRKSSAALEIQDNQNKPQLSHVESAVTNNKSVISDHPKLDDSNSNTDFLLQSNKDIKTEIFCPEANVAYEEWLSAKRLCALNNDDACRSISTRRIDFEALNSSC